MNKLITEVTNTENGVFQGSKVKYRHPATVSEMMDKIDEIVEWINQHENASSHSN